MYTLFIPGGKRGAGERAKRCVCIVCQRLWLPNPPLVRAEPGGCPRRFLPRCGRGLQRESGGEAARGRGRLHGSHGGPGASAPPLSSSGRVVPPVAAARRGQQRAPCRPACSCARSGVSELGRSGRGGRGEAGLPARRCHRRGAAGSARGLRQHRRCDGRLAGTRR